MVQTLEMSQIEPESSQRGNITCFKLEIAILDIDVTYMTSEARRRYFDLAGPSPVLYHRFRHSVASLISSLNPFRWDKIMSVLLETRSNSALIAGAGGISKAFIP